ncbi:vacuolar sorting-associated 72 -like protein [Brachionus plicatilis]|uniref:Vacuolar protein sorting-associated protein 72 homolog n=1 Tax=Brachionus plicatilis TaxID=10195 RepID=A0A3M7QBK0_BRAPC|nr:vacuolar sorting-associated 72 -like protein [Brachionus plicatilis]
MSLVTSRERRRNAGSKMAQLLNQEEEDDFYKTAYGGFNEAEDDQEFEAQESDFEEDFVDSDFDMDENEEPENEMDADENEDKKQKRHKRGVVTKAYKEPLTKKPVERKTIKTEHVPEAVTRDNKSVRSSTARKREELIQRQEEREAAKRHKTRKTASVDMEYRRLTQQELLEEAKITEQINLASLDAYQKMELEKKKKTVNKSSIKGPIIRYHSVAMPMLDESGSKQSRNFLTFTDEASLHQIFPNKKPQQIDINLKICPITGLAAKYFDPLTKTPYATLAAFKILRERFANDN